MSEEENLPQTEFTRYSHLRVNVRRRRTMYKVFIFAVVAVFALSLVDIIWLDEVLFWGVIAAYVVLFVWGIILLIALPFQEPEFEEREFTFGEAAMHCPNCQSVFLYAADHPEDPKGASMTCPVCEVSSRLPQAHSEPDSVAMPKGKPYKTGYHCDHCQEHFVITTLGRPQRPVKFDECPHCHKMGSVRTAPIPAKVSTKTISDWETA